MSEREELEAVIEKAWKRSHDQNYGYPMSDDLTHDIATALLSSGYTKADDLPWRISDIKRGLILFRTSNNAHGYTNHSTLSDRVDALPDRAKQELAGMMINVATGLDPSVLDRFGYTKGNGELVEAADHMCAVVMRDARNRPANPPYQGRRTCLTLSFAERKTRA